MPDRPTLPEPAGDQGHARFRADLTAPATVGVRTSSAPTPSAGPTAGGCRSRRTPSHGWHQVFPH
jgi:hypothetical protein